MATDDEKIPDIAFGTDWVTDEARLLAEILQIQARQLTELRSIKTMMQREIDRVVGSAISPALTRDFSAVAQGPGAPITAILGPDGRDSGRTVFGDAAGA